MASQPVNHHYQFTITLLLILCMMCLITWFPSDTSLRRFGKKNSFNVHKYRQIRYTRGVMEEGEEDELHPTVDDSVDFKGTKVTDFARPIIENLHQEKLVERIEETSNTIAVEDIQALFIDEFFDNIFTTNPDSPVDKDDLDRLEMVDYDLIELFLDLILVVKIEESLVNTTLPSSNLSLTAANVYLQTTRPEELFVSTEVEIKHKPLDFTTLKTSPSPDFNPTSLVDTIPESFVLSSISLRPFNKEATGSLFTTSLSISSTTTPSVSSRLFNKEAIGFTTNLSISSTTTPSASSRLFNKEATGSLFTTSLSISSTTTPSASTRLFNKEYTGSLFTTSLSISSTTTSSEPSRLSNKEAGGSLFTAISSTTTPSTSSRPFHKESTESSTTIFSISSTTTPSSISLVTSSFPIDASSRLNLASENNLDTGPVPPKNVTVPPLLFHVHKAVPKFQPSVQKISNPHGMSTTAVIDLESKRIETSYHEGSGISSEGFDNEMEAVGAAPGISDKSIQAADEVQELLKKVIDSSIGSTSDIYEEAVKLLKKLTGHVPEEVLTLVSNLKKKAKLGHTSAARIPNFKHKKFTQYYKSLDARKETSNLTEAAQDTVLSALRKQLTASLLSNKKLRLKANHLPVFKPVAKNDGNKFKSYYKAKIRKFIKNASPLTSEVQKKLQKELKDSLSDQISGVKDQLQVKENSEKKAKKKLENNLRISLKKQLQKVLPTF